MNQVLGDCPQGMPTIPTWKLGESKAALLVVSILLFGVFSCATPPAPVVNVAAPPCDCACEFKASVPQIGRGCHVQGDLLVCPLVRRTLEIEPAYPSEDPRCRKEADGTTVCSIVE